MIPKQTDVKNCSTTETVNSEGTLAMKESIFKSCMTGSYPGYIRKFQGPETTFTPIICLFNKQGI